jgi:hypothetical protein
VALTCTTPLYLLIHNDIFSFLAAWCFVSHFDRSLRSSVLLVRSLVSPVMVQTMVQPSMPPMLGFPWGSLAPRSLRKPLISFSWTTTSLRLLRSSCGARCANDAVHKFSQFQISTNITTIIITFVSAVAVIYIGTCSYGRSTRDIVSPTYRDFEDIALSPSRPPYYNVNCPITIMTSSL